MKRIKLALIIFLALTFVFLITSIPLAGCKGTTPEKLDIYTWEGYVPEEAAALFEQETGIKVNVFYTPDNERMLTLLRGGGKADVLMPTQSSVNRFYEDGLVQPLDIKKITNFEKVSRSLIEQPWTMWDGSQMGSGDVYAIPYVFGTSGLAINTYKYTRSLDGIGWEVLFDTDLKGRVASKDRVTSLWMIIDLLGIPRENILNDPEGTLDKIRDKAAELKENVLKFYNSNAEILDLMKNEEVWVSYIEDGAGRELAQFDAKFKYVLPETGGSGWTDTFVIPKDSENPAGANSFIDFMLRPEIAAMLTEESGFNTTVKGAIDAAEGIDRDLYFFTEEQLAELEWSPNLPQEIRSIYMTFWEELLALD